MIFTPYPWDSSLVPQNNSVNEILVKTNKRVRECDKIHENPNTKLQNKMYKMMQKLDSSTSPCSLSFTGFGKIPKALALFLFFSVFSFSFSVCFLFSFSFLIRDNF